MPRFNLIRLRITPPQNTPLPGDSGITEDGKTFFVDLGRQDAVALLREIAEKLEATQNDAIDLSVQGQHIVPSGGGATHAAVVRPAALANGPMDDLNKLTKAELKKMLGAASDAKTKAAMIEELLKRWGLSEQ